MKIALAQLNYTVGDFDNNTQKIIAQIKEAKRKKADLIVFSELAVCGYPPLDMLENKFFIERSLRAINDIQLHCDGITAIVGAPSPNNTTNGKALFNSAFVIQNGHIEKIINKTLLPNYDVFDEYRYFESNSDFDTIPLNGIKIGITICEDLWFDQPKLTAAARSTLYRQNPMEKLSGLGVQLIINLSASPFSGYQENIRNAILTRNASTYKVPIVYVNQIGANTDLIFDGRSKVINAEGEVVMSLKRFEEDFQLVDFEKIGRLNPIHTNFDIIENIYHALILGIRDFFAKNSFKQAVIGLSGGLDSAVVAALAVNALGNENITGLLMPSEFSTQHSIDDAIALAKNLKIAHKIIPIKATYEAFNQTLDAIFKDNTFGITQENLQARIRGTLLMAYSNKYGHIVLNTSNKSELAVGYSTLYGDSNGALSVIGDLYKTDVYKLADFINRHNYVIPQNIITKAPSAELRPNQKDSDSLPEYELLDKILYLLIEKQLPPAEVADYGFSPELVGRVSDMIFNAEYKRFQFPPILRVSTKAFGSGRRWPLVARNFQKL